MMNPPHFVFLPDFNDPCKMNNNNSRILQKRWKKDKSVKVKPTFTYKPVPETRSASSDSSSDDDNHNDQSDYQSDTDNTLSSAPLSEDVECEFPNHPNYSAQESIDRQQYESELEDESTLSEETNLGYRQGAERLLCREPSSSAQALTNPSQSFLKETVHVPTTFTTFSRDDEFLSESISASHSSQQETFGAIFQTTSSLTPSLSTTGKHYVEPQPAAISPFGLLNFFSSSDMGWTRSSIPSCFEEMHMQTGLIFQTKFHQRPNAALARCFSELAHMLQTPRLSDVESRRYAELIMDTFLHRALHKESHKPRSGVIYSHSVTLTNVLHQFKSFVEIYDHAGLLKYPHADVLKWFQSVSQIKEFIENNYQLVLDNRSSRTWKIYGVYLEQVDEVLAKIPTSRLEPLPLSADYRHNLQPSFPYFVGVDVNTLLNQAREREEYRKRKFEISRRTDSTLQTLQYKKLLPFKLAPNGLDSLQGTDHLDARIIRWVKDKETQIIDQRQHAAQSSTTTTTTTTLSGSSESVVRKTNSSSEFSLTSRILKSPREFDSFEEMESYYGEDLKWLKDLLIV